jgi:uncharacterized protein
LTLYPEDLAISDWVVTEFSAALSIKLRTGQIEVSHRADALAAFARLRADSFVVLSGQHFRSATRLADQHSLGLRAGDTLHFAICVDRGATICTLDRRLGEVGPLVGVQALLV